ncbi:transposase, partial [Escherichia coli]|uniref:transposase n=1 Tax=Escherichia coli TaxID=562 RepID=UPI002B2420BD
SMARIFSSSVNMFYLLRVQEIVRIPERRTSYSREFKIRLVKQALQPGAVVARIAREHNINDNLLFNWKR